MNDDNYGFDHGLRRAAVRQVIAGILQVADPVVYLTIDIEPFSTRVTIRVSIGQARVQHAIQVARLPTEDHVLRELGRRETQAAIAGLKATLLKAKSGGE